MTQAKYSLHDKTNRTVFRSSSYLNMSNMTDRSQSFSSETKGSHFSQIFHWFQFRSTKPLTCENHVFFLSWTESETTATTVKTTYFDSTAVVLNLDQLHVSSSHVHDDTDGRWSCIEAVKVKNRIRYRLKQNVWLRHSAGYLFSKSSLTTFFGLWITSPAAILLTTSSDSCFMVGVMTAVWTWGSSMLVWRIPLFFSRSLEKV